MPGNYYIDSPRDGLEPQLSAVCFTDHAPVYNFNLIKGTVCYTVWLMHHAILQRGRVLKVSPSPIQGHGSIPDSDSIKSGTRLLLTGTNICHDIVWPIHFLQACRKCTWKPYVLSCLSMLMLYILLKIGMPIRLNAYNHNCVFWYAHIFLLNKSGNFQGFGIANFISQV